MDPDQTAPICEQSDLGPCCLPLYLNSLVIQGNYLQQTTFSDAFFLGALRVYMYIGRAYSSYFGKRPLA